MTVNETRDVTPGIYAVIDDALVSFRGRTLVTGTEVVDFLLDLRLAVEASLHLEASLRDEALIPVPA